MINIPGWVLVFVAGLAILLLGVRDGLQVKPRTARVLSWVAALLGALLAILAVMVAVSA